MMANHVYANGRELACKAGMGKSIAAFPDVCLSPPSPPAGPVPVPYPVTAMDSDTTGGSKNVKISGKEVMLKNTSCFKKCTGDQAATRSFGAGVITHALGGKVYFCMWSMDVKIEGQNAVRTLDMMTHNHMSTPGQTPPWPFTARAAMAMSTQECQDDVDKAKKACTDDKGNWNDSAKCPDTKGIKKARAKMASAKARFGENSPKHRQAIAELNQKYDAAAGEAAADDCQKALRCLLSPWKPSKCCPTSQTPHHLIEKASFFKESVSSGKKMSGCEDYNPDKAACVCVEGNSQYVGTHGWMHTMQGSSTLKKLDSKGQLSFQQACSTGKESMKAVFPASACSEKCIEAQLKKSHEDMTTDRKKAPINSKTRIKGVVEGDVSPQAVAQVKQNAQVLAKAGSPF